MRPTLLILGGTSEANRLAARLAEAGLDATLSYAGRVAAPRAQPLPTRIGGFGGVAGLSAHIRDHAITHLIDATHPFAATMSRNAVQASTATGIPLIALTRPEWREEPGDNWTRLADLEAAVASLPAEPRRVFLAIGRTGIAQFAARPQHHYLLRLVDAPDRPPPLPDHCILFARGPFDPASDKALLESHRIDLVVSKNAGGEGARAKLDAARALGLPVLMIDRPALPPRHEVTRVVEVMDWIRANPPGTAAPPT